METAAVIADISKGPDVCTVDFPSFNIGHFNAYMSYSTLSCKFTEVDSIALHALNKEQQEGLVNFCY